MNNQVDDFGFETDDEPYIPRRVQPPRPPAPSPLPDLGRALVTVALGCTLGIGIRIGLADTGYYAYQIQVAKILGGWIAPLVAIVLLVLVVHLWDERTNIFALVIGTLLVTAATVAISVFAHPTGTFDEVPPWLVENSPMWLQPHVTTAFWAVGLTVSAVTFCLALEHRETAIEAGQRPHFGGLVTLAVLAFLILPYGFGAHHAQGWLGVFGGFIGFVVVTLFGGGFFLALWLAFRFLRELVPGPAWLRAVTLGSATAAAALLMLLVFMLITASRRRSASFDVDDMLDIDEDD